MIQSIYMQNDWAIEHLQIIRTLMERSVLYRRALAPVMFLTGFIGIIFSGCGLIFKLDTIRSFIGLWLSAALIAAVATLLLARRQALKAEEPFWSGPTKRVINSLLPPMIAGFLIGLGLCIPEKNELISISVLPSLWIVLYGEALHSAGFFMQRGMKLFGLLFVLAGSALFMVCSIVKVPVEVSFAHIVMGTFFGVVHIGYGIYLYFTEKAQETK